jgi:hypothetical protein
MWSTRAQSVVFDTHPRQNQRKAPIRGSLLMRRAIHGGTSSIRNSCAQRVVLGSSNGNRAPWSPRSPGSVILAGAGFPCCAHC